MQVWPLLPKPLKVAALTLAAGLLLKPTPLAGETARRWTAFDYPSSFEHVTVEHGLSHNIVRCLLQDRKGFLWIGTGLGLNRYDGSGFRAFHTDPADPSSLSDDWITCLLEDSRGYVWIGTHFGGLTILDPETLKLLPIRPSKAPGGLPLESINALAEDKAGTVWIATNGEGLCTVSPDWRLPSMPTFKTFEVSYYNPTGAPIGVVNSLHVDRGGTLWIGSRFFGLGRLLENKGDGKLRVEYHPLDAIDPGSAAHAVAYAIREDRFGLIWVGSDAGPLLFDPKTKRLQRVSELAAEGRGIGDRRVMDILEGRDGTLWLASDGGGLVRLPPRQGPQDPLRFQSMVNDPKDSRSLSGNGVQCLLEDRSGVLWISSFQMGLNKLVLNPGRTYRRESPDLRQYRNSVSDPASLSGNMISAVGEDRFGNLWVGTDGFGLNRVRPSSRPGEPVRFERFRKDPSRKQGALPSDVILTFHLDEQKRLWLGTYDGGLVRVDQASASARPTFTHFRTDPADPSSLSSNFIRYLLDDGSGGFWVATDGNGLNHFDPRTGKAKRYSWGSGPNQLSSESIWCMAKDAYGTLWMATGTGLNRLNPATDEVRVYRPGGPGSLSLARLNTLYLDEAGTLWVGTAGGGLNKATVPPWDGPPPVFTSYGVPEGLPNKVIQAILPDHRGNLWISTLNALCRFDIREGKAHPFTYQYELRKAEFVWNAAFRNTAGEMCFGSNDGLSLFHPEDIVPNPVAPPIAIRDFQILNKSVALKERLSSFSPDGKDLAITLYPKDTSIAFDFASLHYVAPERNQYAFLMEGLDQTWREAGNAHSVSYTTLPPGDYVLRARASNCDGVWSEEAFRLKIQVLPPWYKTWWFRGLLVLLAGGAVWTFIRVRLQVVHARNRHLEEMVEARTLELRDANQALEQMSLTDPLTGLRNRRFLSVCMPEDIAQVAREQQDVALNRTDRMKLNIDLLFIMVDLDHFKHVNDTYGHQAGDKVLQQLSAILNECVRTSDTVTRWGGEEFLIIARHTARTDATVLPERIRAAVEAFPFDIEGPEPLRRTCSLGFSVLPLLAQEMELLSWEQVVKIADTCLYAAKANGRNAWVGVIPDAEVTKAEVEGKLPADPAQIPRSGLFPVLSSLGKPVHW